MKRKQIVVQVRNDGTMAAITKGLKGPSCLDEVARIEALCGAEVSTSDLTEDYYRDATDEAVVYRTEIEEKNS